MMQLFGQTVSSIKVGMSSTTDSFKQKHSLEKRKAESVRMRSTYPDRIPIVVERAHQCTLADIDKKKFLVPGDLTFGQFVYVVRKRLGLTLKDALFLFAGDTLPANSNLVSVIYQTNKDKEDGFLYITYASENPFG